ncbi:hypothetical protein B5M47_00825 [candidate division CPR3 bacterium 4484_211]|uniref:Uncharacterized protein n=1 Tax=candidate division CPR3 bacterium 4484_211 TaxID=1968527 RepID=A0A1W9NZ22_UNCC3|nr:MAG: hypothetical protein B5M47_00825 [candidate division CPR3 bacterium 4484_211]
MTVIQQALIIFAGLQIFFAWYEYRARPDPIHVATKLLQPKYLITSTFIALFYLIVIPILKRLAVWFFNV